ncbi:MAG: hypothetical protein ACR2P2_02610 [Nakamurella sp.]
MAKWLRVTVDRSAVQWAVHLLVGLVVLVTLVVVGVGALDHARSNVVPGAVATGLRPSSRPVAASPCFQVDSSGGLADQIVAAHDSDRYDVARAIYVGILDADRTNTCAAVGLAALTAAEAESTRPANWAGRWAAAWSVAVSTWWTPLAKPLGTVLGVAVLLAVLARLCGPAVIRPLVRVTVIDRRASLVGAVVAVPAASLVVTLTLWGPAAAPDPRLLIVGVVTIALGVVAAVQLVGASHTLPRAVELRRWVPLLLGLALLAVSACTLATGASRGWLWLWTVGAGLTAVVWVASARGGRLAVQLSVRKGSEVDDSAAQLLLARLCQLGSEPPRGIHGSPQTDVTALPDDALNAVPGSGLAKILFTLLQLVRPGVPWSFDVVLHGDVAVTWRIRRNGVPTETVVSIASLEALGISSRPPMPVAKGKTEADVLVPASLAGTPDAADGVPRDAVDCRLTVAAAALLVTLSRTHTELSRGLCGAKTWQSIAWYTLAMASPRTSEPRRQLLSRTVLREPGFGLARFAELYLRPTTKLTERQDFVAKLSKLPAELGLPALPEDPKKPVKLAPRGWCALQLRLLHGIAAGWLNIALLTRLGSQEQQPMTFAAAWRDSARAALALVGLVRYWQRDHDLAELCGDLRVPTYYLLMDLRRCGQTGDLPAPDPALDPATRSAVDEMLCTLDQLHDIALWKQPSSANDYYAAAAFNALRANDSGFLTDLEHALSGQARMLVNDPSFAPLYAAAVSDADDPIRASFKQLVGRPRAGSFHDLPPFRRWADVLRESGFDCLDELARERLTHVRAWTGVPEPRVRLWREIGRLATFAVAEPTCDRPSESLEVLALLLEVGVSSVEILRRETGDDTARTELYARLAAAAQSSALVPTRAQTINRWTNLR